MTWNYRIVEQHSQGEIYFTFCESYYNSNGELETISEPLSPWSETLEDFKAKVLYALGKPIIRNYAIKDN